MAVLAVHLFVKIWLDAVGCDCIRLVLVYNAGVVVFGYLISPLLGVLRSSFARWLIWVCGLGGIL